MSPIKQLNTLAFRLAYSQTELPYSYYVLPLPAHWSELIDDLRAAIRKHSHNQFGPRTSSLNRLGLALFPQLIVINKPSVQKNWIYSTEPIKIEYLRALFSTWLVGEYRSLGIQYPQNLHAEIYAEDLRWYEETSDLAEIKANVWGTAEPANNLSFSLVPELLADRLAKEGLKFDYGSEILEFRRAPSTDKGVELISWPPLPFKGCAYSVYLRFTLQTIPFQAFPVVHCNMGLRRWVSRPSPWLGGDDHSVYILTSLTGAYEGDQTQRFQKASIRRKKVTDKDGKQGQSSNWVTAWDDHLPQLFADIHAKKRLPEAEEIMQKPLDFIRGKDLNLAMVFDHTTMSPDHHKAKSGLMPPDRSQLTEQVSAQLSELGYERVPPPQRVLGNVAPLSRNVFFPNLAKDRKDKQKQAQDKQCAVARAVGKKLRIELWYQSDTVVDSLITALTEILGIKHPGRAFRRKGHFSWTTPELLIELRAHSLGDLGNALEDAEKNRRRALWRRAEVVERAIQATVVDEEEEHSVKGALVEIAESKHFSIRATDPKDSIRAGFAQSGRVTQFINPSEKELSHRAKMAVLDLLRQLNVQSGLPLPSTKAFLRPVSYAAVWLFKPQENARSFLPMMLWMKEDGSEVLATASGLGTFLPYPEFLRKLAQRNATIYLGNNERNHIPIIFRDWLQEISKEKNEDVLLFIHGQKIRGVWPWLNNPNLSLDSICFGQGGQLTPISQWPGLRVIRIRETDSSETPESFAQNEGFEGVGSQPRMSFTQGLFQSNARVFYSVAKKPKQRIKLIPNRSKAVEPDFQAWNPGIVEFAVTCIQEKDDPSRWAMLAHKLREAAVHSDNAITLPLPLHLLSLAKEYAMIGVESR